jgi:hypothetical protein
MLCGWSVRNIRELYDSLFPALSEESPGIVTPRAPRRAACSARLILRVASFDCVSELFDAAVYSWDRFLWAGMQLPLFCTASPVRFAHARTCVPVF